MFYFYWGEALWWKIKYMYVRDVFATGKTGSMTGQCVMLILLYYVDKISKAAGPQAPKLLYIVYSSALVANLANAQRWLPSYTKC